MLVQRAVASKAVQLVLERAKSHAIGIVGMGV